MKCTFKSMDTFAKGFTLIEIVVVIGLMAILFSVGTMQFSKWSDKSKVDAQVRQMVTDISAIRIRAMTKKQPHSVVFNEYDYSFKAYTSVFSPYSSIQQQKVLPDGIRKVKYPLNKAATGTPYAGEFVEFDERGMNVSSVFTIFLGNASNGALNCLTVHTVRTNVGNSSSGACNDR
jgi:prepilin-type N-terminal cleavage/methylation domain-containing protein